MQLPRHAAVGRLAEVDAEEDVLEDVVLDRVRGAERADRRILLVEVDARVADREASEGHVGCGDLDDVAGFPPPSITACPSAMSVRRLVDPDVLAVGSRRTREYRARRPSHGSFAHLAGVDLDAIAHARAPRERAHRRGGITGHATPMHAVRIAAAVKVAARVFTPRPPSVSACGQPAGGRRAGGSRSPTMMSTGAGDREPVARAQIGVGLELPDAALAQDRRARKGLTEDDSGASGSG
jgi:hypothetical protein